MLSCIWRRVLTLKKLVVAMVSTNLGMVAVAAIVGLILGNAFGLGQVSILLNLVKIREIKPMVDTFRALIPSNPIQAAAETNVIGIVVFAIILGSVARLLKKQAQIAWKSLLSYLMNFTN